MFGVSSDLFSLLLTSAVGLTVFILFSDFQDIYRRMEVSVARCASVMTQMCQGYAWTAVCKSTATLCSLTHKTPWTFIF